MQQVFDKIRRRYVALTPEEEVRQHILFWLLEEKHISQALISFEGQIKVAGTIKRYDILIYDKDLKPWMVVECKRPQVVLNEKTLNQILRYNLTLGAPYVLITNSESTFIFSCSYDSKTQSSHIEPINYFPKN